MQRSRKNDSGTASKLLLLLSIQKRHNRLEISVWSLKILLDNFKKKCVITSYSIHYTKLYESYDMFHSLNIASGDFAIPCKGIVYSKGRPTGVVEGITMSGNMKELLLSIEAIGSRMDSVSMVMSKSFQVLAPGIYVNNLHVTG